MKGVMEEGREGGRGEEGGKEGRKRRDGRERRRERLRKNIQIVIIIPFNIIVGSFGI